SAPKCSATGAQSAVTRNRQPKAASAGRAAYTSRAAMPSTTTTNTRTAARTVAWYSRSPQTPRRRPGTSERGTDSRSAVDAPASSDFSILSSRDQERLAMEAELADLRLHLFGDLRRQRRVEEIRGVLLPVRRRPVEEIHDGLALRLVGLLLVDEEPREAGDRVGLLAGCVRQRHAEVRRHVAGGARGRRRRALDGGHDELARLVPDRPDGELVLDRVRQLHVAERARRALDLAGDALVAFAAQTDRPLDRRPAPDLLLPLVAHLGEIVREDIGRAAPVRPVHDDDRVPRQGHPGVGGLDSRRIPLLDLPEEDVGQDVRREAQRRVARQVVRGDDRAQ